MNEHWTSKIAPPISELGFKANVSNIHILNENTASWRKPAFWKGYQTTQKGPIWQKKLEEKEVS